MQTEYFFIDIFFLVFLTVMSIPITIFFCIAFKDEKENKARKRLWGALIFFCALLFCGGSGWIIASINQPLRYEYTSLHDIKDVTFPDGSKVQMFTCDNIHHNVTSMFGKIVGDEWLVRRVRWSPLYLGIKFSGDSRCGSDRYFLERKILNARMMFNASVEDDLLEQNSQETQND